MICCFVPFATRTIRHEKGFSRFEDLERTIEMAIESPFYFFFANTFMHSMQYKCVSIAWIAWKTSLIFIILKFIDIYR